MDSLHKKLLTYAYNITGSYEDARDLVQDVLEKYIRIDKTHVENESNFLVRSVINHALNFKKRQSRISGYGVWLPEPVATEGADKKLVAEDTARYSMLVLMEKLTPRERGVFVLKEGFDYTHEEIADVLSITVENSRKLLSRAREKLEHRNFSGGAVASPGTLAHFVAALQDGDTKAVEGLLTEDITLAADGGAKVKVVAGTTTGITQAAQQVLYVYHRYLKGLTSRLTTVNHQPALLYAHGDRVISCIIFDMAGNKVRRIYSMVDPQKLHHLS